MFKIIVQLCFGDIPQLTTNPNGPDSSHFNGSCNPVYVCQASCDLFHYSLLFEDATFKMCYAFFLFLFDCHYLQLSKSKIKIEGFEVFYVATFHDRYQVSFVFIVFFGLFVYICFSC